MNLKVTSLLVSNKESYFLSLYRPIDSRCRVMNRDYSFSDLDIK